MPEIHCLTVQTDKPGGTRFPHGAVEIGYWFQDGDYVFLCDQDGVRTGDKRAVPNGVDAKTIAILLLKSARRKASGFNSKLIYRQLSYY
jgi:hypothetical protein